MTDRRRGVTFTAVVATADELRSIPLFDGLSEADLETLAPSFEARTVGGGVRLIGEGASGYEFFVLAEGTAAVTHEGAELTTLGPGDFFGEIGILGGARRSATVATTSPAKILVLFGTEFRRLAQTHPDIAAQIEETMRRRVGDPVASKPQQ